MVKNKNLGVYIYIFLLCFTCTTSDSIYLGDGYYMNDIHNIISSQTQHNVIISTATIDASMGFVLNSLTDSSKQKIMSQSILCSQQPCFTMQQDVLTSKLDSTIFQQQDFQIKKSFFAKNVSVNFRESKNAAKQMNLIIGNETDNKIKDFVQEKQIERDTSIVLENSFLLNAEWLNPFNETYTGYRDFYVDGERKTKMNSMIQVNKFHYRYLLELEVLAIDLPFKNTDLSMLVLLPENKTGLSDLSDTLVGSFDLRQIRRCTRTIEEGDTCMEEESEKQQVYLQMPVINFEKIRIPLKQICGDIGLGALFSKDADYTPMNPNSFLKAIEHGAYMKVTENGVAAAGVTASIFGNRQVKYSSSKSYDAEQPYSKTSEAIYPSPSPSLSYAIRPSTIKIILNRPFFFAILDDQNIFFTGSISTPIIDQNAN